MSESFIVLICLLAMHFMKISSRYPNNIALINDGNRKRVLWVTEITRPADVTNTCFLRGYVFRKMEVAWTVDLLSGDKQRPTLDRRLTSEDMYSYKVSCRSREVTSFGSETLIGKCVALPVNSAVVDTKTRIPDMHLQMHVTLLEHCVPAAEIERAAEGGEVSST